MLASGLIAYDNQDYSKWLTDFWDMMMTLPKVQLDFFSTHFSQSISGLPYSCMPLDMWIEVTMNLYSKLKGGWLGVLNNEKQLFSITRIANNVARVKTCLNKYLNCKRRNRKHVEWQPARLKKDEQAVQDLVAVLEDFNSDPFDDAFPTLRSLQTGIVITSDILQDFNTALDDGKEQVKHLLEERIFNKEKALNATLKRNKRKNFSSISISGATLTPVTQEQMERSGLAALLELADGTGEVNLERVLKYRITQESLSIFNVDGTMHKASKCPLLGFFKLDVLESEPEEYISIVDMGLIWRKASPTSEDWETKKRDGSDYKWKEYLDKVCNILQSRHSHATKIILVNDRYDIQSTIKDDEHDRRAAKNSHSHNIFPTPDSKFPGKAEFVGFLVNNTNKIRLQKLVKDHLQHYPQIFEKIIYFEGNQAINLYSGEDHPELSFNQVEADTMMLTAYAKVRQHEYSHQVVIDTEDTDVCRLRMFLNRWKEISTSDERALL